ncbi:MBOAT family O-acyltransferase [Flavilitoribacter nigricans]|uniref:Membrane-bound O-acyltransferase family protein n=1 Tax=Flavilitoribacter nigricans (strain ATCC 23147 / DSM 23189 / NBRC 102662 / NCIMB 1420 / SS-2) TaxID=1122177 RepID=A0A2D0NJD1_FLAN2|nr:MBOAT family O-acyltransferase [Flavilitoribacter nigricans]PHN08604.1 membrane-bound O-acyltransferase family protein [Flavilitoribacter nigricans DSM 23189 = NBRC 102662]
MLFNSIDFALFLPLVFGGYWLLSSRSLWVQNFFILLVSYLFYGWWDWRFLSLIVFSSLVDFSIGKRMGQTRDQAVRKRWLYLSLAINLGLLGFFKYYNFFVEEFIGAFHRIGVTLEPNTLNIILPVGISFYTFQTLSYTIDVYRGKLEPTRDWLAFFAYVSFFPQLVAGPIERSTRLLPQFQQQRTFNYEQARDGMRQILWGLFKKIVIADSCAVVVNDIFANYETAGTGTLILGAVLFAFQIYGDFSGYSDIAIGTARLFGFDLMRNFAYPYFSRNVAEFWRRWHISLSTWFRDYVYIPLGGSRVESRWILIRNVFIVFLVSGFWHGANWTFIVWGALHACFFLPLILLNNNRSYLDIVARDRFLPTAADLGRMLFTFALVCIGWVFFRAENLQHALDYLAQMVENPELNLAVLRKHLILIAGVAIFIGVEWLQRRRRHAFEFSENRVPAWARAGIYLVTALCILLLAPRQETPFIYFQF